MIGNMASLRVGPASAEERGRPAIDPVERQHRPPGQRANLTGQTDEMIGLAMQNAKAASSDNTLSSLWNFGGATAWVPAEATAFGDRSMGWMYSLDSVWSDHGEDAANIAWARDGWKASERFGDHGAYLNLPGHGEDDAALTRTSFGSNYQRLLEIKTKYDPENRFRFNQNIAPGI